MSSISELLILLSILWLSVCVYVGKERYSNIYKDATTEKPLGGENTVFGISFLCCFLIFYNSYALFIKIKLFLFRKQFQAKL